MRPAPQSYSLPELAQPLSFTRFLEHCLIESDGSKRGPVPFDLYGYQQVRAEEWGDGRSEVELKARQMGFSWLHAALKVWVSGCHEASHSCVLSKSGRESKKQLWRCKYIISHYQRPELLSPLKTDNTENIEFANGSSIIAFPSTQSIGISYTFRLIVADEGAFHPWGEENYGAYIAALAPGGQYILCSTADPALGPNGFFYDMWMKAQCTVHGYTDRTNYGQCRVGLAEPGDCASENGYHAVFTHWGERPGRDEEWRKAQRKRYAGMGEAFDAYYPDTPAAAFVGKSGLVYQQFSRERFFRQGDPIPWEECTYRVASADYGGGDPYAMSLYGVYKGAQGWRVHGYGLFHHEAGPCTVDELYGFVGPWHDRAKLTAAPSDHDATINASLSKLCGKEGLFGPADKSRGDGFDIVAKFLDDNIISFNDAAFGPMAREFASYRWLNRTDPNDKTRYATSTPVDHHGDCLDTLRYALMFIYFQLLTQREKPRKPRGVTY